MDTRQAITDMRRETALIITALDAAPEEYQLDYDALHEHVCAAVRLLKQHHEKLEELEETLDNGNPTGGEGVA